MTNISANELMTWGLKNLSRDDHETPYAVRHGKRPVKDFGKINGSREQAIDNQLHGSNYKKAFPCIFPWGRGGIDVIREVPVSFNEHIKWALQYFDRRFRIHETFPFVAFGIAQKRQALMSAKIQMKRKDSPLFVYQNRRSPKSTRTRRKTLTNDQSRDHRSEEKCDSYFQSCQRIRCLPSAITKSNMVH
jgi:hypothetical protein